MTSVQELIEAAVAQVQPGKGKDEPFVLAPGAADRLGDLLGNVEEASVTFAVAELCTLAGWLKAERASPGAARALIDVAATAIPALQGAAAVDAQAAVERMAKGKLDNVTGAARTGLPSPAPEGAARGGALARLDLDKALPRPKR
jgi:hypothetical protein